MKTLFENEIALVLIVKNEARYIGEWLEYHYRIGVDKFYIYDNESEDRSELLKILTLWIQAGVVEFEDALGKFRQLPVYNDAIERHRFDCRYMGFIDTDEFIFVKTGQTLPEFLDEHFSKGETVAGLGINWRIFGSSQKQFYEPADVIDRFTFRAPGDYIENLHVKTICNPRRILYMPLPHNAQYMIYSECCDEDFRFVRAPTNQYNTCEKIQLNHYYTKSIEEYALKCGRGRSDCDFGRDEMLALNQELNRIEDTGLRDFWNRIKLQPLPQPKDRSSQKTLENIKTMLSDFPSATVESMLTCFFAIRRCKLQRDEKMLLQNNILECLTSLVEQRASVIDLTILLVNIPQILGVKLPASRDFLTVFKEYLPQLILEYQTEVETVAEFHARHIQALLNSI